MKLNLLTKFFVLLATASVALSSCTEEIDQRNRYTFTGETIADYLQNREDV